MVFPRDSLAKANVSRDDPLSSGLYANSGVLESLGVLVVVVPVDSLVANSIFGSPMVGSRGL